jgi:putative transport protein
MDWLIHALRTHPELALFLTLAFGYALGELRVGGIHLGSVIGVLLIGVAWDSSTSTSRSS